MAGDGQPALSIRPLESQEDRERCARLIDTSEPWITLGRGYEAALRVLEDPSRETYLAFTDGAFAGFLILTMKGAFVGYIQTVCMVPEHRNRGLGRQLIAFAEERIFRESNNVFLCVSSFNTAARRLYERLGYELIGELQDYLVRGHSELLMRKTIGPIGGARGCGSAGVE